MEYNTQHKGINNDDSSFNKAVEAIKEAKAIRFSTLKLICEVLDCQPGDILEYESDKKSQSN